MSDLAKVKRNVAKMVSMGAPEADIDGYIASEGTTIDAVRAFKTPSAPEKPAERSFDAAGATLTGMVEGVPIAGPYMLGGLQHAGAAARSLYSGKPHAEELKTVRGMTERAQEAHPILTGTGNVVGAVAGLAPVAATGAGAAALGLRGGMLARTAASTASGAGIGAADSAARGGDPIEGAKYGGLFGAAAPAAGKAIGMVGRALGKSPKLATVEDLQAVKTAAYADVDKVGARYTPQAYDVLLKTMHADLMASNISKIRHPRAVSMFDDMVSMRGGSPTLTELDQLRQVIRRDVVNGTDEAEAMFGEKMMDRIDAFIDSAKGSHMASGDPKAAANAILKARSANTRYRKVEMVEDAVTRAARRAASTGSGGNVENTLRQEFRKILESRAKSRSFTAEEKEIMERIVDPKSKLHDLTRLVGKLSPSGNGLMAALSLGATATNPLYAIPAGIGIGAKAVAEGSTKRGVSALEHSLRGVPRPPVRAALPSSRTQLLIQGSSGYNRSRSSK